MRRAEGFLACQIECIRSILYAAAGSQILYFPFLAEVSVLQDFTCSIKEGPKLAVPPIEDGRPAEDIGRKEACVASKGTPLQVKAPLPPD